MKFNVKFDNQITRRVLTALLLAVFLTLGSSNAFANHPVLVEGNCNNPPAGSGLPTGSVAGTCGDYDGDGRIGTDEDNDGDRVFGTLAAALGAAGIANNGTITIVTSGTFPEVVTITGNVTLQAAPGVSANIDAVLQGDAGSGARQGQPGIIVNSPANRYVVIRNIQSKNWTSGIRILGNSRVAIENCRFENNINYGIEIKGNAKVTVAKSEVHATGFRLNPATGDFPTTSTPNPGTGIEFDDSSSGTVFFTTVTGSFGAGISNQTGGNSASIFGPGNFNNRRVCVSLVNVFDNTPNFININPNSGNCNTGFNF